MSDILTDILSEEPITFGKLAQREKVHISTVWRWSLRGCKGHVLESFSKGGRKYTTCPAYERWLAAINGSTAIRDVTPRQREAAISRAEKRAEALGV